MDISKNMNIELTNMESVTKKFEDDHKKFANMIFRMSEEVRTVKHCAVGMSVERDQLKEQLKNEKEEGLMMNNKIGKLEVELDNEKGEKEKLFAAVNQLKKATGEMDVTLKERDEQKRQAIRQLCLWCDNVRTQYEELKMAVSKASAQRRQGR